MSEGKPLSSVEEVPSLVNSDGLFLGKKDTMAAAQSGNLSATEVRSVLILPYKMKI